MNLDKDKAVALLNQIMDSSLSAWCAIHTAH